MFAANDSVRTKVTNRVKSSSDIGPMLDNVDSVVFNNSLAYLLCLSTVDYM